MSNLFKPITPDITELKTGTPIIKQGDRYIVAGIGGDFIPGGQSVSGDCVDTSDATAKDTDISAGETAYVKGELVTGKMEDVTAVIDGNTITIPAGRVREEQNLIVQSGSISLDKDTVSVAEGYIEEQTLTVPAGNVVVDETANKVVVSAGYVQSQELSFTGGGNGGSNVILGQVNEDGDFQALSFNGTVASNSGDPETVEAYYTYNGVLPIPECGGGGSAGCELYKCVEVFGPTKVVSVNVSGAGTTAVNGDYEKTGFTSATGGEVWKHLTDDYYYYDYDGYWCIHSNYNAYYTFAMYHTENGETWYSGYDPDTNSLIGASPAPTVSKSEVTIDVPKTWNGYKAVKVDGFYTFEETLTTGLSYGIIIPLIDSIYNSDASAKIESLLTPFIETGLTFSNDLSSADGWRFSGAEIVQDDNRQVFQTSGGSTFAVWEENPGVPLQSSPRTMSFWFKATGSNSGGGWCGIGYGTSGGNTRFTASFKENYPGITLWADDYFQTAVGLISQNTWHHYVYTYDGEDVVTLYVDAKKVWEWCTGTTNTTWQYIHVGDPWEDYASTGRFADLNIYNRVLEAYEIAQLYNYRTV